MAETPKRPKKIIYTSPKGSFIFPKLNEPDFKFKKDTGEFAVKLRMSLNTAQPLIALLDPMYVEAIRKGEEAFALLPKPQQKKNGPFKANLLFEEVMEGDNETGDVSFKFAMTHSGTDEKTGKVWKQRPTLFNAKGVPMTNAPAIWGGTVGKVSFSVAPYWIAGMCAAGLKLRLEAVQIITLVSSGSGRDAKANGFGEEDGYDGGDGVDENAEETPTGEPSGPQAGDTRDPF